MNSNHLDFEQPIAELQAKIDELKNVGSDNAINLDEEIQRLQAGKKSRAFSKTSRRGKSLSLAGIRYAPIRSITSIGFLMNFTSCMAIGHLPTTMRSLAAWPASGIAP